MKYDAIVIGAGPNGLVAAITLARRRKRVLVLESASEVGGHTRTLEFAPGFRTPLNEDTGWAPERIERITGTSKLQRAGGGVSMSVATPDGTLLHLPARLPAATENIAKLSPRDATRWPAFVERMQKFADLLGLLYRLTPPDIDTSSAREVLPLLGVGRRLRALGRADMTEFLRIMPMSAQDLLDDTFENESLKAALGAAAIRDIRQGPRSGGTTYNFLHYMVGAAAGSVRGRAWFAESPDAFARTAADMARKRKVEIRTDVAVARITAKEGTVTGVVLANGEEIEAKRVLSTADPKHTLLTLADSAWLDPDFILAVKNVKLRGCTAYVCYGVDRALDDPLKSYTTSVSLTTTTAQLEQAADAAKYGEISAEPHVEVFSPTLRWPTLAPEGKHIVVARVQYAPHSLRKGAWDTSQSSALEKKTTAALSRVAPKFSDTVVTSTVVTPRDVEERFGVTEGALTHGELTLDQILFMRPVAGWGRYAMPIAGLYLGGSGAHPGPGILGGAGYLAAKALLREL